MGVIFVMGVISLWMSCMKKFSQSLYGGQFSLWRRFSRSDEVWIFSFLWTS